MLRTWFALLLAIAAPAWTAADDFARQRARLLEEVRADVRETREALGRPALAPEVLEVLGRVPRHEFVPEALRRYAYDNRPLAIGYGQTISQPYIVAIMTDLLDLEGGDRVLEVGTGSAYQAAVLAELVERVFTIEILPELGEAAAERLRRLGYDNVTVRVGDGYYGWPDEAPFDAVIVTAAASHVPPPLVDQLAAGGRMMIPVGAPFSVQHLMLIEKSEDGTVSSRQVLPVAFVPLTGEH